MESLTFCRGEVGWYVRKGMFGLLEGGICVRVWVAVFCARSGILVNLGAPLVIKCVGFTIIL